MKNLNFNSKKNRDDIRDKNRDKKRDKIEIKTKADEMEIRAEMVLKLIRENPNITIVEMARELSISRQKAERAVIRLQEKNIISREGNNRNGNWIINE